MNTFCMMCGTAVVPGTRFCGHCGAAVALPSSVSNAPARSGAPTPATPPIDAVGSPILAICAGIASFVWSAIMLVVVLYQMGLAVTSQNEKFAALGLWNGLIVFLYIGIGIGILLNKRWAWDWGVGSNMLNMLFGIYQLTQGVLVSALLLPVELFILIALYAAPTPRSKPSREDTVAPGRKCPFCFTTVTDEAKICRFCARDLRPDHREVDHTIPPNLVDTSSNPPFCGECGVPLPLGSKFCNECGATVVRALEFTNRV